MIGENWIEAQSSVQKDILIRTARSGEAAAVRAMGKLSRSNELFFWKYRCADYQLRLQMEELEKLRVENALLKAAQDKIYDL